MTTEIEYRYAMAEARRMARKRLREQIKAMPEMTRWQAINWLVGYLGSVNEYDFDFVDELALDGELKY